MNAIHRRGRRKVPIIGSQHFQKAIMMNGYRIECCYKRIEEFVHIPEQCDLRVLARGNNFLMVRSILIIGYAWRTLKGTHERHSKPGFQMKRAKNAMLLDLRVRGRCNGSIWASKGGACPEDLLIQYDMWLRLSLESED